jgi:oligopeptide transport system substrate-binding protein
MRDKAIFAAIFYVMLIVACSKKQEHSGKTSFRYNEAAGLNTLDPAFARDQSIMWPCMQIYNGLVQFDDRLLVKPCIAASWEIVDSGLTYVFHLRQDVFFHKNFLFGKDSTRKVTAKDFVYSFNRLIDPKVASPGRWVMSHVVNDKDILSGVEAANDSTVVIRLKESFPPFLSLLTIPYCSVVPFEVVNHFRNDFRNHPCGTGPFRFSFWKEGMKLILLKNENYFEDDGVKKLPHLDAVEITFLSDKQSAFIEFLKGNLDFLNGVDQSYKDELITRNGNLQLKYREKLVMETRPYLNVEYLGILMNDEKQQFNALKNKKIRQAMNISIDKRKMILYLRNNVGAAGDYGMIPPGMPAFDSTLNRHEYNPSLAAQLLMEAGYPNGQGLPEIVLSTTSNYQDLCEFIKSEWEALGIKVKIDVNQAAIHRKMVSEQKLSFFRASWIADYPDAENYLSLFYSKNFTPNGPNYTHFSNSTYDELFKRASSENNDSIRYHLYNEMDSILMENNPVIILFYDKVFRIYHKNISGLGSNALNMLVLKRVRKE